MHALIAAAASPGVSAASALEIDRAYFPWAGALHSLLDSLVDRREDHLTGQRSLIGCYASRQDADAHLARLAAHAARSLSDLPAARAHRVILTAMCSYYLSAPQSAAPAAQTSRALTAVLGPSLPAATAIFRTRRLLHAAARNPYT